MKLFPILNKPSLKAGNKQAGIVFLEYVIMAFIATVAVICAIWWLYWHLQQMTWEIKGKLDVLKTLNCELEPPYGAAPEDQPTPPALGFTYTISSLDEYNDIDPWYGDLYKFIPTAIPYSYFTITITNLDTENYSVPWIDFYDETGHAGSDDGWFHADYYIVPPGSSVSIPELNPVDYFHFGDSPSPPYYIGVDPDWAGYTTPISVTVTSYTP